MAQPSNGAVFPSGLQPQDPQGLGNDHALLGVVWRGDTLEDLKTFESSLSTAGLVGNHTADGLVEDARRGAEVEGSAKGVEPVTLPEVRMVLDCIVLNNVRCQILANDHFPVCMYGYVGIRGGGGYTRLFLKNSPEMFKSSHLTTTTFWPLRSCLATMLAKRPRRCPLPSIMTCAIPIH